VALPTVVATTSVLCDLTQQIAENTEEKAAETELVADPHIWHDARNNGAMVETIADYLVQINPDQADLYQQNAAALVQQFADLDTWMRSQIETIPEGDRRLITTHDAFRYVADAYGVEVAGALSG